MDRYLLALALAYIQNNTKKKKQELNEKEINPIIEIANEKNQIMNKFNNIKIQKQRDEREQIEELQELKQDVEIAKYKKMQQKIINIQTTNGYTDVNAETIDFNR